MTPDVAAEADVANAEAQVDWINGHLFAVQVDGADLIHIDLSRDGTADITVFASDDPEAPVIARHTIRWNERNT